MSMIDDCQALASASCSILNRVIHDMALHSLLSPLLHAVLSYITPLIHLYSPHKPNCIYKKASPPSYANIMLTKVSNAQELMHEHETAAGHADATSSIVTLRRGETISPLSHPPLMNPSGMCHQI